MHLIQFPEGCLSDSVSFLQVILYLRFWGCHFFIHKLCLWLEQGSHKWEAGFTAILSLMEAYCAPRFLEVNGANWRTFIAKCVERSIYEIGSVPNRLHWFRSTVNMASFKSQLSKWYQNKFQESFNTNNVCSWVTCCQCSDYMHV